VHSGSRVSTASGRLFEVRTGRLVAHGTTTCLLMGPATAPPRR
jgi:acyl-coenzyme A thioesterase PaaI-like protein